MELKVKDLQAQDVGTVTLSDDVFGLTPRNDLIEQLVRYQLAKRRSGTRRTKTRAEIAYTGTRIGRQKGGGRARHGSRRAPIFRGGGRAHGPVVRSHEIDMPKRLRKLAMRHVLSAKCAAGQVVILDSAVMEKPATKVASQFLSGLGLRSAIMFDLEVNREFDLSVRNIPNVGMLAIEGANGYDILRRENLVLTRAALEVLEERLKS